MRNPVRITRWLRLDEVSRTAYGEVSNAEWLERERLRIGERSVILHAIRRGPGFAALALTPVPRDARTKTARV